ncbi:MAG: glycosyltransferase family 4 protein [Candidatus Omnitrophica bacterium]|nr:glycosyltransferase family 4 protein [Candidatus Omnitrophota bacterium]
MALHNVKRSIAILGNHLPRRCGIATFTSDLSGAIEQEVGPQLDLNVIAMTNRPAGYKYPERVKCEIRQQILADYEEAAIFINSSKADVLNVQHEYGIFGGEWGSYLIALLRKVKVPIVTTLHTILDEYHSPKQKEMFHEIVDHSDKLVVMSEKGVDLLRAQKVHREKIVLIPHGIPSVPFEDPSYYKKQFGFEGKTVVLTFGLLSANKGIEFMIDAMAEVVKNNTGVIYIVLGATHPDVIKQQGEEYRRKLMRQVEKRGLEENVFFHNRFVELQELCEYLCAADMYAIPYLYKKQITSGTLCYALAAGKAVISTPIWCSEELLAQGRGILVPFKDPGAFAEAIIDLANNQARLKAIRKSAYDHTRGMVWSEVAKQYLQLFDSTKEKPHVFETEGVELKPAVLSAKDFPIPTLDQIKVLTDDFGLCQHARFTVPDYSHGYCVDDNARAMVVATKYWRLFEDPIAITLLQKYMAFVLFAQRDDGLFRNFYSITKHPLDDLGSDDCQGRALWGLGYVVAYAPDYFWYVALHPFERAAKAYAEKLNLRGSAYAVIGLYYYLQRYPENEEMKSFLRNCVDKIISHFKDSSNAKWKWFENKIAYGNGVLPLSVWAAYDILRDPHYRDIAQLTTNFLMEKSMRDGIVSLIGCEGWLYEHDEEKAHFDQQPVDAMWLVELNKIAYNITKDSSYLKFMRMAVDWFLGVNDVGTALYDHITGGCYDGLTPRGPNLNQGAESTLAAVLSLLTSTEMTQKQHIRSAVNERSGE